ARRLSNQLPPRIAKVALAVELADVPRRLVADPVDRADKERVRHRVCRLFKSPEVFRQSGDRRRRVEHDLGAVESELARALGEMPVVADVHTDVRILRLEHRVPEVARAEVELL